MNLLLYNCLRNDPWAGEIVQLLKVMLTIRMSRNELLSSIFFYLFSFNFFLYYFKYLQYTYSDGSFLNPPELSIQNSY